MSHTRTTSWALAVALLVGAVPAARAEDAAPDAATQAKAVIAEIDAAEKAKDDQALATATKRVSPLYKSTQDAGVRTSLAKTLGGVVKNAKLGQLARRAALVALVETDDGPVAWKALSSAFPGVDSEDPEKFDVEILRAIGTLHPDGAIEPLLETYRKSKNHELSAEAVKAFAGYGKSKQRERILEEIVKSGKNMVPSKGRSTNVSPETLARWEVLGPAIAAALDGLTGTKGGDAMQWFKRVDDAKKNLKSLFAP